MSALPQQNHLYTPIYLRLGTIKGLLIGSIVVDHVRTYSYNLIYHYMPANVAQTVNPPPQTNNVPN